MDVILKHKRNIDKRKELWLRVLRNINSNWEDGDINDSTKTPDLLNRQLKIAIELKHDETNKTLLQGLQFSNLTTISNQYKNYAKSAHKKFFNYKDYKKILIIETEMRQFKLQNIFKGIIRIEIPSGKTRRLNKYLSQDYKNVDIYILCSWTDNKMYYLLNPFSCNNINPIEIQTMILNNNSLIPLIE